MSVLDDNDVNHGGLLLYICGIHIGFMGVRSKSTRSKVLSNNDWGVFPICLIGVETLEILPISLLAEKVTELDGILKYVCSLFSLINWPFDWSLEFLLIHARWVTFVRFCDFTSYFSPFYQFIWLLMMTIQFLMIIFPMYQLGWTWYISI